ncbi:speckle-type POZ protein-like A [Parasteatoda tepidariorum]|uniref:speckle-type POZ protein-like A n=1 Tax=Parasteatoda tepidariorum TaxID=114398 RepID=UPI0039BC49B7
MAQNEFKVIDFNFEWKIERFFSFFENCNSIESPHLSISAFHSIYFTLAIEEPKHIVVTVQKSEDLKLKLSEIDINLSDTNEHELEFFTSIQAEKNAYVISTSKQLSPSFKSNRQNRHLSVKCHMFFGEAVIQSDNNDSDALELLKLSRDIRKLNDCEEFSDIKLQVGDSTFNVHRAILSARAPNLLKESVLITDVLNINHVTNISSPVFKLLMKYIYCVKLDTPNFQLPSGLLKVVDKLKLDSMKRKFSVYPNQIKLDTRQSCSQTSFTWSVLFF